MKLIAHALACLLLVSPTALRAAEPAFAIRGTLPWHNFLSGPSAWNESDYRAYLDDLAAKGLNFVAFHCYTGGEERYAPYVEPLIRVKYRDVLPEAGFDTSLTARWGYRPLAVREFAYGTERLFNLPQGAQAFGADCAVTANSNEDRCRQAQALMRKVIGGWGALLPVLPGLDRALPTQLKDAITVVERSSSAALIRED